MLYAYTPKFAQQGGIVQARKPARVDGVPAAPVETRLYADAGHALFVDEAEAFGRDLERFVERVRGQPTPGRR